MLANSGKLSVERTYGPLLLTRGEEMASSKTCSGVTKLEGKGLKSEAMLAKVRSTLKAMEKYYAQKAFDADETEVDLDDIYVAAQKQLDAMWKKAKKNNK